MNKGWIKIHRSMLDWQWYTDPITFKLLLHLILTANFEQKKWKGVTIKKGQRLTSQVKLAEEIKVTRKTLKLHLNRLIECGEITVEVSNRNTLVTLTKWEQFQVQEDEVSNKVSSKVSIKVSTTKEDKEILIQKFKTEVQEYLDKQPKGKYDIDMVEDFFNYWIEPNKKGMPRFKLQEFFYIGRRLGTWNKNYKNKK